MLQPIEMPDDWSAEETDDPLYARAAQLSHLVMVIAF